MYVQSHIYKNIPVSFDYITTWNQGVFLCSPYIYIYTQFWLRKFRIAPDIPNVNTACQRVSVYSTDVKLRTSQHQGNWTPKKPKFQKSVAVLRADKVARITSANWGDTPTARTFLVSLNRSTWLQSFSVMYLMSVMSRESATCVVLIGNTERKITRKEAIFKTDNSRTK